MSYASPQEDPKSPLASLGRGVAIVVFFFFGVVALNNGVDDFLRANASAGWPSVEGVVTESVIDAKSTSRRRPGISYGSSTSYRAKVEYDYRVNGVNHSGDVVAYGDFGGRKARAEKVIARYPQGTTVPVYYEPDDPSVCVLDPGLKPQVFLKPVVGMVCLTLGACLLRFPQFINFGKRRRRYGWFWSRVGAHA